jgi:hypothetical protein
MRRAMPLGMSGSPDGRTSCVIFSSCAGAGSGAPCGSSGSGRCGARFCGVSVDMDQW